MKNYLILTLLSVTLLSHCATSNSLDNAQILEKSNRGAGQMGQFDFQNAYTTFTQLSAQFPDNGDIAVNRAIALLNRQQKDDENKALAILEDVLATDPDHLRAKYCRALLLLHMGKLEEALNSFARVLTTDPNDSDAHYFYGKTLMQLSRYEEALQSFQKALQLDQYIVSGYYGAIISLRQMGKRQEAQEMIKQYRQIQHNPRARTIEFKYTRMGDKALVKTIDPPQSLPSSPKGPLFAKPVPITLETSLEISSFLQGPGDITFADINNDGSTDIFIAGTSEKSPGNIILTATGKDAHYIVQQDHPLSQVTDVNSVLWGDVDNNGLVDAYFLRRGENQLWLQLKPQQWSNVTATSNTAAGDCITTRGKLFDADHDGDLDILLAGTSGCVDLLNNNRDGSFTSIGEKLGLPCGSAVRDIVVQDLDGDRDADLVILRQTPPHQVLINDRLWQYRLSDGFNALTSQDIYALTAGDMDSDGSIELYSMDGNGTLCQWTHTSSSGWTSTVLRQFPQALDKTKLSLLDCDGNTQIDLVIRQKNILHILASSADKAKDITLTMPPETTGLYILSTLQGPAILASPDRGLPQLLAPGPGRFSFASLNLSGKESKEANLRSNVSGIGVKIAARTGANWTTVDTYHNTGDSGQSSQPITVGLGGARRIDFISVDWPDGVFQTEINLDPGHLHEIAETQRQMSSCPVLFAWDGEKFDFVTDLLGVGGIGYNIGPGVYSEPRPWEHLLLPERFSKPRSGRIEFMMAEPMEEVEYLDHVTLTAYDLPPGWSMTLDERMGILDPQPTGKPLFFRNVQQVEHAINDRDEDVTAEVISADHIAAPVGRLDRRFIGMLQQMHSITLTFSESINNGKGDPILVADGWIEYPYSQTSFAAWQAGASFIAPTLEYMDTNGNFTVLYEQFGYPAGMVRQMAIPLADLPQGVTTLRLTTNQEIYWDRIFIATAESSPAISRYHLPLEEARLDEVGFAKRIDFAQRRPYYDWSQRTEVWDSRLLDGNYTRFGNILELLMHKDNGLAIIGPGDGIHLSFTALSEPIPPGWTRRYVLSSFGWCKDMDLYTNDGETVAPLPGETPNNDMNNRYNIRFQAGRM